MKVKHSNSIFRILSLVLMVSVLAISKKSHADPMREFVLSCSYGVLAGTLVGSATLAFSDKPGDNLNKVARGASIGLYAGILLGFYVVYGVPDEEVEIDEAVENGIIKKKYALREIPKLQIMPLLTDRGVEGAHAQYQVWSF